MSIPDKAADYAVKQVGKPYVWGATGPDSFDCSGLVWRSYKEAGYNWSRTNSQTMMGKGKRVSKKNLRRGDLVFPDPGHVVIYLGGGKCVGAQNPRDGVEIIKTPRAIRCVRLAGGGASSGSGGVTSGRQTGAQATQAAWFLPLVGGFLADMGLDWLEGEVSDKATQEAINKVFNPSTFIRVGEIVFGAILLWMALKRLGPSNVTA